MAHKFFYLDETVKLPPEFGTTFGKITGRYHGSTPVPGQKPDEWVYFVNPTTLPPTKESYPFCESDLTELAAELPTTCTFPGGTTRHYVSPVKINHLGKEDIDRLVVGACHAKDRARRMEIDCTNRDVLQRGVEIHRQVEASIKAECKSGQHFNLQLQSLYGSRCLGKSCAPRIQAANEFISRHGITDPKLIKKLRWFATKPAGTWEWAWFQGYVCGSRLRRTSWKTPELYMEHRKEGWFYVYPKPAPALGGKGPSERTPDKWELVPSRSREEKNAELAAQYGMREIPEEDSCRGRIAKYVRELDARWKTATNRNELKSIRDAQIHNMRYIAGQLLFELGGSARDIKKGL